MFKSNSLYPYNKLLMFNCNNNNHSNHPLLNQLSLIVIILITVQVTKVHQVHCKMKVRESHQVVDLSFNVKGDNQVVIPSNNYYNNKETNQQQRQRNEDQTINQYDISSSFNVSEVNENTKINLSTRTQINDNISINNDSDTDSSSWIRIPMESNSNPTIEYSSMRQNDNNIINPNSNYIGNLSSDLLYTTSKPKIRIDVNAWQAAQMGLFRFSLPTCAFIFAAYSLVFIIGIVGNSFVVTIVCKSPKMRTVTNIFIANLALADILVLVLCLPATLMGNIFVREYQHIIIILSSINRSTLIIRTTNHMFYSCFHLTFSFNTLQLN